MTPAGASWQNEYARRPRVYKGTAGGEAIQFGASRDSQTAADTAALSGTVSTGAATFCFIEAVEKLGTSVSYGRLLHASRPRWGGWVVGWFWCVGVLWWGGRVGGRPGRPPRLRPPPPPPPPPGQAGPAAPPPPHPPTPAPPRSLQHMADTLHASVGSGGSPAMPQLPGLLGLLLGVGATGLGGRGQNPVLSSNVPFDLNRPLSL